MTSAWNRRPILIALVASLTLCACRTRGHQRVDTDATPLRSSEMGSMHNVSVAGSIWFGGIPSAEDIDLARRRGIARVIALCDPSWRDDELVRRCADLNLEFERVPVREGGAVPGGSIESVLEALDEADEKPVLMFCDTGGKSAMFFAIHRVLGGALELEDALVEARRAGMKPGESEAFVRDQVAMRTGAAPGPRSSEPGAPDAPPDALKTAETKTAAPEADAGVVRTEGR